MERKVINKVIKDLIRSYNKVNDVKIYAEIYTSGNSTVFSLEKQSVNPFEVEIKTGILVIKETYYKTLNTFKNLIELEEGLIALNNGKN